MKLQNLNQPSTIRGIVLVIVAVLGMFGYNLDEGETTNIVQKVVSAVIGLIGLYDTLRNGQRGEKELIKKKDILV